MSERTIPPQDGTCDECGRATVVYDFMGDVLCGPCAFPESNPKRSATHSDGSAVSPLTPGEADELMGLVEAVRTTLRSDGGVSVDQPPLAVGVRFPPYPPASENTEGTDEESEDPEIRRGGQAALPSVRSISLEDRLYVALARRGSQCIGKFIARAFADDGWREPRMLRAVSDEEFVAACERYADSLDPERAA